MPRTTVSVAVCTYNRAASLRDTLLSLGQMHVAPGVEWELIVIDNNSTDDTQAVVAELARSTSLPVHCIFEPRQGLSNARNRAIEAANGSYIAFTDDDVRVTPNWMTAYVEAIHAWPNAAVFGGPVRPVFEGSPPAWLLQALPVIGGAFALRDFGPDPQPLLPKGPDIPFGANMMVRAQEQRVFLYDAHLGAGSPEGYYGEETKVLRAIMATGGAGRWVPEAAVHHVIPQSRQTTKYLWDFYRRYGRTGAHLRLANRPETSPPVGIPRWLIKALLLSHMNYAWKRLFAPPQVWCEALAEAAFIRGRLDYNLGLRSKGT